jgi:hypothetical protein
MPPGGLESVNWYEQFHNFYWAWQVFVKDLCKDHAGWPLNNMESSYKFMVKHVQ